MSDEHDPSASRDQRVDAVIAAYLEAVDAGRAPDRQELLGRHPELAGELEAFFADHDRVDQLAQPLRLPSPPASRGTVPDDGATGAYGTAEAATLAPVHTENAVVVRLARTCETHRRQTSSAECSALRPNGVWSKNSNAG
jgi:hypothetical protein